MGAASEDLLPFSDWEISPSGGPCRGQQAHAPHKQATFLFLAALLHVPSAICCLLPAQPSAGSLSHWQAQAACPCRPLCLVQAGKSQASP